MYTGSKLSIVTYTPEVLPILESPLKQLSSGIEANSVVCKKEYDLVFKAVDNSPACVKPSTAEKLIQRGWARE